MRSRRARRQLLLAPVAAGLALVLGATPAIACRVESLRLKQGVDAQSRPMGPVKAVLPDAQLLKIAAFNKPTKGNPSMKKFKATLTRNPDTAILFEPGFTTPGDACEAPVCRELTVTVPKGKNQTLYARASWPKQTQYAHLWGIAPDGTVIGASEVDDQVEKSVGNQDVLPISEFTLKNPMPGTWRLQIRAVFGVDIPVVGYAALSKGDALRFPRLNVKQLANKYMTHPLTYNIVMVNRRWSKNEIARFRSYMPQEYREAVLTKSFADGGGEDPSKIVRNWKISHYNGTKGDGTEGNVPYFEPIKFKLRIRFLQPDKTWTEDLFRVMKKATKRERFTVTSGTSASQADYIELYDAVQGKEFRGPDAQVVNPIVGDKIDAFKVEDWVFAHRYDKKYKKSFRDMETGEKVSGAFITPDPGAYYDPYYTRTGKQNLDRMPQGPVTSWSFFAMDTFNGPLARKYFSPNHYHYFDVSDHYIDPDVGEEEAPDYSRLWGGRYRFFMHDLGAGPNVYEAIDFFLGAVPGSAAYPDGDPPIWDYDNDPKWQGKLVERTARDANMVLFGRFGANYLYRPIPADSYVLANHNWVDCYSNPQCSPDGISYTRIKGIYDKQYAQGNLKSAVPAATFLNEDDFKGFKTDRYLGCSANRAVANPDPAVFPAARVILAPNPLCTGKSDPLQELLERAKARGDELVGLGVNDAGASPQVVRQYVEEHRDDLAPQPKGAFTLLNVSVVWPGVTTWALPAIVGGVSFGTPNEEAWGDLNNVNDRAKSYKATDCSKSKPVAPGCNGVPAGPQDPGNGFSYTIAHESSHFLGLAHPHDVTTVEKDAKGKWRWYGSAYVHYGDFTAAPTTYAGVFGPYTSLDQDILQRGHAAEYLRQQQDALEDAYLQDGAKGRTKPSKATKKKVTKSEEWRKLGSRLFGCGDYLHAERAMRNASLSAQGIYGPVVRPRNVRLNEKVLFKVNPQPVFGPDGGKVKGCKFGKSSIPRGLGDGTPDGGPDDDGPRRDTSPRTVPTTGMDPTLPLIGLVCAAAAALAVRRRIVLR